MYRCRNTRLGRDIASEVILADGGPIDEMVARFEREARAVAALNHPNILTLHDIGNHAFVGAGDGHQTRGHAATLFITAGRQPLSR